MENDTTPDPRKTRSIASPDRLAPTRRPASRPIGFQTWKSLLFVHWAVEPSRVQSLLPDELELDTWDGQAWIGLVPFTMLGVRPSWFCAVPGISDFHETNVRTYVLNRGEPGVWFFSLDAAKGLAVRIARWKWNLPYFKAQMSVRRSDQAIEYCSLRLWPEPSGVTSRVVAHFEHGVPDSPDGCRNAEAETLEHFLLERYLLFTQDAQGRILRGQVHHAPYPWVNLNPEDLSVDDQLIGATGLQISGPPDHVAYSPGVDVDIHPLKPV